MSPHDGSRSQPLLAAGAAPNYASFVGADLPGPAQTTHTPAKPHNTHPNASKSLLTPTDLSEVHDLVCVGFGPASLSVAVALHDNLANNVSLSNPKVLFLEKQTRFAWHAGMLLPGAKMQISFIKDMATLRDPRSHFTFLNYLQNQGRLVDFTNLSTFLPARVEYEDYLRWCAAHFDDVVQYRQQVVSVSPDTKTKGAVKIFTVTSRDSATGKLTTVRSRNVLIAVGGQPSIPSSLPNPHPRVIHSSQYAHLVPRLLKDKAAPYRVAVVGAGQSAAEIFNNIQNLYPNSKTWLVMRSEFLKPSDDSPFVNSIFNPSYTDSLFPRSQQARRALIQDAKATNYGVVRLELIEHLYEKMYEQRREFGDDERKWPHRVMGAREIASVDESADSLRLRLRLIDESLALGDLGVEEVVDADLVIAATGYQRSAHLDMLRDSWGMLPEVGAKEDESVSGWQVCEDQQACSRKLEVGRDYRVQYAPGTVAPDSGVYLQGCCEMTHGVSLQVPPCPRS